LFFLLFHYGKADPLSKAGENGAALMDRRACNTYEDFRMERSAASIGLNSLFFTTFADSRALIARTDILSV